MTDAPLPMTRDRAFEINNRLTTAWMIRGGIIDGPIPSFRDFSLAEAETATRIVLAEPPVRDADGSSTHTCRIALSVIPKLYAWVVCHA